MTNCGHSFCERCIVPAYPESGWRCPLCNQTHSHPASALARNYFAEQLLTAVQAQLTQAPTTSESVMRNLPNQNLQNEKSSDDNFTGPFHSFNCIVEWKTLGKIMIYKNFKLSFEWKMKSYDAGGFFRIENWFYLVNKAMEPFIICLKQDNGLYKDCHVTNQVPFPIHMGQWLKEFWTKFSE